MLKPRSLLGINSTKAKRRMKSLSKKGNRVADESVSASTVVSYPMTNLVKDVIDLQNGSGDAEFEDFQFDFHNLVFEGGGNKGLAYVGTLMVS